MNNLPDFTFGLKGVCTYCGDPADSIDHIIPVSANTIAPRKGKTITRFGPTTFACRDCNAKISSRGFDSFWERCQWRRSQINEITKPVIWSSAQINELGYSLKTLVAKEVQKRRWMIMRSDWFESRDFFLCLEQIIGQDCLDPRSDRFNKDMFAYFQSTLERTKYELYMRRH